jgi:isopenicillin-N epimerase
MDRMWRFLCGKQGARYIRQQMPLPLKDPAEVVETVWSAVTDRTRVLFLSHITSPSGVVFPVEELVRRARERGILTVIDGAHVPGQIDCDLHALGADFWSGNCHKWLMAPKGAAALYARRDVQHLIEPMTVSWGWESDRPGPNRFVDEQEWTGTRDFSSYLSVPAAIDFFQQHEWPSVRRECHKLLLEAREELLVAVGLPALCPPEPWLAQMCAVPLPEAVDPEEFGRALRADHLVEIPVTEFAGRHWLRVSIQGYNNRNDVSRLVSAVKELIS